MHSDPNLAGYPRAVGVERDGQRFNVVGLICSTGRGAEYQLSDAPGLVAGVCHAPPYRVASAYASGSRLVYFWSADEWRASEPATPFDIWSAANGLPYRRKSGAVVCHAHAAAMAAGEPPCRVETLPGPNGERPTVRRCAEHERPGPDGERPPTHGPARCSECNGALEHVAGFTASHYCYGPNADAQRRALVPFERATQ
jgi:hypothetical protein